MFTIMNCVECILFTVITIMFIIVLFTHAEGARFELAVRGFTPNSVLAGRWFKPLTQPSSLISDCWMSKRLLFQRQYYKDSFLQHHGNTHHHNSSLCDNVLYHIDLPIHYVTILYMSLLFLALNYMLIKA